MNIKVAATALIFFAGIAGSYLIVKNAVPKIDSTKNGLSEENSTSSISQNPIKWLGKTVAKLNDFISGDESSEAAKISLPENIDFENINLTEFIAKSAFTQMKNLDQSGKNPFENMNPNDPENRKFIESAIAQISDPSLLLKNYSVNDKDLKISSDNSFFKKADYLMITGKIIYNNANDLYRNPIKVLEKLILSDVSNANKLADTYQTMFNGFLKTETPSDWLALHKKYLNFLKKSENLYRGLTDFNKDPVKVDLLVRMIPDMIKMEYGIQKEYYEKEKEMGIK